MKPLIDHIYGDAAPREAQPGTCLVGQGGGGSAHLNRDHEVDHTLGQDHENADHCIDLKIAAFRGP